MSKEKYPTSTPHNVVCLYHANCMDGLLAAALTYRFYQGAVECIAVRYQEEPPIELLKDKYVYLVDFSYPPEVLAPHVSAMKSLTILDHHQDAVKPWLKLTENHDENLDLGGLAVFFDNDKSGARLVWDYFFGTENADVPVLVQYAQEYDLWTKQLPETDEVQSGLRHNFPPHKAQLGLLADFVVLATDEEIEKVKEIGRVIIQQEKKMAESLIKRNLQFTQFLDYENIPVCYMPAELVNIAGDIIYTRHPEAPFVVLFEDNYPNKSRKYSFRSRRDGGANVSRIAARLGGKGHYNSSGAKIDLDIAFEQTATHDIVTIEKKEEK